MDPAALKRFGANVRDARLALGWTQEALADAAELNAVQVSRVERGVRQVRLGTFLRLVTALQVPPQQLLDGLV